MRLQIQERVNISTTTPHNNADHPQKEYMYAIKIEMSLDITSNPLELLRRAKTCQKPAHPNSWARFNFGGESTTSTISLTKDKLEKGTYSQ